MFVVNSAEEIIFYSVGSPGSYHDGRVARRTNLMDKLQALPPQYHVLGKFNVLYPVISQCQCKLIMTRGYLFC